MTKLFISIAASYFYAISLFTSKFKQDNNVISNLCINNTECNFKFALKRCNNTDNWSVHGLWLDYNNGSYPSYCSKMEYLKIPLSLEEEMSKKWYSCEGDNSIFWMHELQKHASCIRDYIIYNMDSNSYFYDTLKMYDGLKSISNYICKGNSSKCLISFKR